MVPNHARLASCLVMYSQTERLIMSDELMCQCESSLCRHEYLAVPAGDKVAAYVGPVCTDCADTHLVRFVIVK